MQRFVNAAIAECAVDVTFVLDRLGSQDKEGLCRLREICTTPFSAQASHHDYTEMGMVTTWSQLMRETGLTSKRTCVRLEHLCDLQAENTKSTASFQMVVCALLHLLTLPTFANTVLNQCYNPILTVVESSLDMREVCKCVLDLGKQGLVIRPRQTQVRSFHQTWQLCPSQCVQYKECFPSN